MSQVTKRVCDLCGKEITDNLDTGNVNISYSNSIGYMNSHNIDLCKDCAPTILDALKATLEDVFAVQGDEISDLGTFFQKESIMHEEMRKYEEEQKKLEEGNNSDNQEE